MTKARYTAIVEALLTTTALETDHMVSVLVALHEGNEDPAWDALSEYSEVPAETLADVLHAIRQVP